MNIIKLIKSNTLTNTQKVILISCSLGFILMFICFIVTLYIFSNT